MLGTSLLVRKVAQPTNYRILVNRVQAYHYTRVWYFLLSQLSDHSSCLVAAKMISCWVGHSRRMIDNDEYPYNLSMYSASPSTYYRVIGITCYLYRIVI